MKGANYTNIEASKLLGKIIIDELDWKYIVTQDAVCFNGYHWKKGDVSHYAFCNRRGKNVTIRCWHLWDVQQWLRDKYNIDVLICKSDRLNKYYPRNNEESYFDTYEEALNEGIKKALTLI